MQDHADCVGHYGIESIFRDLAGGIAGDRIDCIDVYASAHLVDSLLLFPVADFYSAHNDPEKIERSQAT